MGRTATGLAVLVATAALLLTGCGKNEAAARDSAPQTQDMQQKLDNADQAAAEADSDATQDN